MEKSDLYSIGGSNRRAGALKKFQRVNLVFISDHSIDEVFVINARIEIANCILISELSGREWRFDSARSLCGNCDGIRSNKF